MKMIGTPYSHSIFVEQTIQSNLATEKSLRRKKPKPGTILSKLLTSLVTNDFLGSSISKLTLSSE